MTHAAMLATAAAYDQVGRHLDDAGKAMEACDKPAAMVAMAKAMRAMDAAGKLIVADPILLLLRLG